MSSPTRVRSWWGSMDDRAGRRVEPAPRSTPGLRRPGWADFAAAQHRWLQGADSDLMPWKHVLKSGFWRKYDEGHQTIRRSALILKQFANVIPVSQNENNSLGFLRLPGKGNRDLAWAKGGERDLSVAQGTTRQVRGDRDPRARRRLHRIGQGCSSR